LYINISKENASFIAQTLDKDLRDKHSARFVTSYGPLPRPTRSQSSETRFWSFWVLSTAKKTDFVSCHPISLAISELTHNELPKRAKKPFLVHRHFNDPNTFVLEVLNSQEPAARNILVSKSMTDSSCVTT